MRLFEFESSGFYAAEDREAAINAVMRNCGYDRETAEGDFYLKISAAEHAKLAGAGGYCFGGEQ